MQQVRDEQVEQDQVYQLQAQLMQAKLGSRSSPSKSLKVQQPQSIRSTGGELQFHSAIQRDNMLELHSDAAEFHEMEMNSSPDARGQGEEGRLLEEGEVPSAVVTCTTMLHVDSICRGVAVGRKRERR